MAIDIKHINTSTNNRVATPTTDKSSAKNQAISPETTTAKTVKSDSVSITPQAQQLQNAQAKLNSLPEIDTNKVEQIKAAIAEGRYKIDADKLASNIAQFENELKDLN